jgi:two-component system, chemotaxis family, chemotaxis protein CheY
MKILAVDDSPTVREMLVSTLVRAGHKVLDADDGMRALALLAREEVDLIISDLNMAKMSGFELLQEVRESATHMATPFIILTTETDGELKQAARQGGATAWMVKPFDPATLIKLIKQLGPA